MKIVNLLFILNQLRLFHWQTKSFAQHKAFGKTYDELNELIDTFVEVFIGKYGRTFNFSGVYDSKLYDYNDNNVTEFMDKTVDYLTHNLLPQDEYNPATNSDLYNIRDEMLGQINRLKYLLTLK